MSPIIHVLYDESFLQLSFYQSLLIYVIIWTGDKKEGLDVKAEPMDVEEGEQKPKEEPADPAAAAAEDTKDIKELPPQTGI